MTATNTTASTVPSTVTAAASAADTAETTSVPPTAATSAGVKTAGVPTTTAADKQDVEKLTRKLGCTLTTNGKSKGSILKFNCYM